jgi:hypothetical protein
MFSDTSVYVCEALRTSAGSERSARKLQRTEFLGVYFYVYLFAYIYNT